MASSRIICWACSSRSSIAGSSNGVAKIFRYSSAAAGTVVPAAAELYRKILATPFDDPAIDDLLLQAQQMILDDAIVYTGLGAPVSLVLPDNLTGVISNGFGDVEWRKASFA